MAETTKVSLDITEARDYIYNEIINGSFTGELIDEYEIKTSKEHKCLVLVFEKHYYRAGNRLTLTIVLDNFEGFTKIHYVAAGGGTGLMNLDWGSASSFEDDIRFILERHSL